MQYVEDTLDVSSGQKNVAVLIALKETLVKTGQLDPVVKAFAQVDSAKAALFESLGTKIPPNAEQLSQWYDVAYWLDRSLKPVMTAYWSAVPQATVQAMPEEPFAERFSEGMQALKAYRRRGAVEESELFKLNPEELLGRKIAYYFGDPESDDVMRAAVDAHNDMWKQAQAYIAKHRAAMCSQ